MAAIDIWLSTQVLSESENADEFPRFHKGTSIRSYKNRTTKNRTAKGGVFRPSTARPFTPHQQTNNHPVAIPLPTLPPPPRRRQRPNRRRLDAAVAAARSSLPQIKLGTYRNLLKTTSKIRMRRRSAADGRK
jgi:hypothetical protein